MADIRAGETFDDTTTGKRLDATRLNNHVNGAVILPESISARTEVTPVTGDYVTFWDASASPSVIAKATFGNIATAVGVKAVGTMAGTVAAGDDSRFPISLVGIRKGAGIGSLDVAAKPPDYALAPTAGTVATGGTPDTCSLDCTLNNRFQVTLPNAVDAITITLAGPMNNGDRVEVLTIQGSTGNATITFVSEGGLTPLKWVGGVQPTKTAGAGAVDLWIFHRYSSWVLGKAVLAFA